MPQERSLLAAEMKSPVHTGAALVLYAIGLDTVMVRALRADFPAGTLRRRHPLRPGQSERRGRRPDAVVLDVASCRFEEELKAIRHAWGLDVVVVGVDRRQPYARVWRHPRLAEVVELAPGFLTPFLAGRRESAVGSRGPESHNRA